MEIGGRDVDGAREEILERVRRERDRKVFYFYGWDGFGASAVLRSIAQVLPLSKTTPELCFDRIIYIDCSAWKSRRAMQRAIAEELKLDDITMAMFHEQDEEDDFHGVDRGSRDVIVSVAAVIHQTLTSCRFMMIFLNGSDDEVYVESFGVPSFTRFGNNIMIWTFKRRFLTMHRCRSEIADKLRYTHLFLSSGWGLRGLTSSEFRALLHQEVARHTCMRGIDPTVVADCCLYELFLHYNFHSTTKFSWAAHASNYWICDRIVQGDRAREIGNALHREISWECDASLLDDVLKEFMEHLEPRFLVVKDGDVYEEGPYRWISLTSRNAEVHGMQSIPAATSSFFLAFESSDDPSALPNGFFEHSSNLGVLTLSCCAFNFASPPFLKCHSLRFLGLDHCTDEKKTGEGEDHAEWACLYSLWVLDLRYTDWSEILSQEKMDLMGNLQELNIEGVRCWQYTSRLQGRVPNLHRLRIIKPTCGPEKSIDTSNSFLDKTKLEILDLSGNSEMDALPNSLTKASSLQVLVLDGCNGLENVVVPDGFPHLLRSFSIDGYGPASHWTPTIELPPKNFRPSIVDKNDAKIIKISLEGCTQLENVFLRGLPNLVELDLSGTAIKILDFKTMVVEVPGLKRLFLLGCERLRAIIWDQSGSQIQPKLELLCIDTRAGIKCPRPSIHINKSFQLQMHAIIVDGRLTRSLWQPISPLHINKDVFFNIHITSSHVYSSGVVQLDGTCKEKIDPGDQVSLQQIVPAGQYSDVFSMVGAAPMKVFPHPPTTKLGRHIEVSEGTYIREYADLYNLYPESMHVHDVSINRFIGDWEYLRQCRVERCPKLETVFDSSNFEELQTIWVSDLLMARCIWDKGWRDNNSFKNLRHLHLRSCPRLQFVLPVWVSSFPSLETIHIIHCGGLRHVFVPDRNYPEEIADHGVAFPKLSTIHLHDLPMLQQICEVKMVTPALETIKIRGCWGLRRLPALDGRKPAVEIEKDVWDALEWDGVEASHHPDFFKAPIHSRYYKKKLPRVSVLR